MKKILAERVRWARLCAAVGILCAACVALADPLDAEEQRRRPSGAQSDPFFRPESDRTFQQVPQALDQEGQPVVDFFAPEDLSSLENLPRAIGADGTELGDLPESEFMEDLEKREQAAPKESWLRRGGYLEYRGTYSTNIDLSAPGVDFDLRRTGRTNVDAIREVERNDFVNSFELDYDYEFAIQPEVLKAAIRYNLYSEYYSDNGSENNMVNHLEFALIRRLSPETEWEVYGGFETENRDTHAQFLRPDYDQNVVGTEVRHTVGEGKYLSMGYEYKTRNYESNLGGDPLTVSPYMDWTEQYVWSRYYHDICPNVTFDVGLSLRDRDHESPALDPQGARQPGTYRDYDLWEPRVGLYFKPSDRDQVYVFYRYRDLDSTGEYYDYQENVVTVQYRHDVLPQCFPGLVFRSEFEWARRSYDDQVSFADDRPILGLRTAKNDPRDDERITLYFALEREFNECWTTGIDFTYVDNDSNDDSSRYQEDRYGFYVRREF